MYARVLKVVILYYDVQGYIAPEHIDKGEISFKSDKTRSAGGISSLTYIVWAS
jgi:hypothetical protein